MKLLTTLFTLLLSCTTLAQGPVEFPWNPDSDGDDFIGVNDLMALLGEFDSVFSEEGLYVTEEELAAAYNVGQMNYFECTQSCSQLPGRWKIPSLNEAGTVLDGLPENATVWLFQRLSWDQHGYSNSTATGGYGHLGSILVKDVSNYSYTGVERRGFSSTSPYCVCFTQEQPKVEYSFCEGTDTFESCVNVKVQDGWYPLQGTSMISYNGKHKYQAFWRWAE